MKRGDVWTVAGGADYVGKPRPAVVLQDDAFSSTHSVTICPLTSSDANSPSVRPVVIPSPENGLRTGSRLMVDKITTVSRAKLQTRIGRLAADDITRMNRSVFIFLGLASTLPR